MRKIYDATHHDVEKYLENGEWPEDEITGYAEIGERRGETVITEAAYMEIEDRHVALAMDFFAAHGAQSFYIANLEIYPRSAGHLDDQGRQRLKRIESTRRADISELEWLLRSTIRDYFWCHIVIGPVTYFFHLDKLYMTFSFDDDDIDIETLDPRGLSFGDATRALSMNTVIYPVHKIPPGSFDK